jgi:hypothetical protein
MREWKYISIYSKTRHCFYMSDQIHALATLSCVKELPVRYPLIKRWGGGGRCQSWSFWKEERLLPLPIIEPRILRCHPKRGHVTAGASRIIRVSIIFKAVSGSQNDLFCYRNIACRASWCFCYITLSLGSCHRPNNPGWLAVAIIFAAS